MSEITTTIDPVVLTEFARGVANNFDEQKNSLSRFLPSVYKNDIRYSYSRVSQTDRDEATFRAFDAPSPVGRRPSATKVLGELLPISRKIPVSEYANLRIRNASGDEIVEAIFDDAQTLTNAAIIRVEKARAELLETGKITVAENGIVDEYDSGRHANMTPTALASNARWSEASTCTPITNLITWRKLGETHGGMPLNRALLPGDVLANFLQADEVRETTYTTASIPTYASFEDVRTAVFNVTGVVIEPYTKPFGVTGDVISHNKIVMLRDDAPFGVTNWGRTLESMEPEYAALDQASGFVAGSWSTKDPINVWVHVAGIVLPLLGAPDLTLGVQVQDA